MLVDSIRCAALMLPKVSDEELVHTIAKCVLRFVAYGYFAGIVTGIMICIAVTVFK